jgi:hypothetical protein
MRWKEVHTLSRHFRHLFLASEYPSTQTSDLVSGSLPVFSLHLFTGVPTMNRIMLLLLSLSSSFIVDEKRLTGGRSANDSRLALSSH